LQLRDQPSQRDLDLFQGDDTALVQIILGKFLSFETRNGSEVGELRERQIDR
jgi:hypothetical protein